ncbi:restriction endonuclease subunit S [Bradyrhizobium prioriisuperbiae]|uniref:restriction endonuclease subunit S n=1 Tax=Bradyrhizobium prioriisuperbiae TaxID=2854389 RepID=UPI0028F12DED|nr:restriction endonuclease subunit S [Bradyrhizobium prioritasuperba]
MSAVTWGRFDASQSKTLPPEYRPPEQARIHAGDLLFSRANTLELVGAVVLVETEPDGLFLSDKILRLVVNEDTKKWVLLVLRSAVARKQIEELATGNQFSMRNISQDALRRIKHPLPPAAEQRRIVTKLDKLTAHIARARTELDWVPMLADRERLTILRAGVTGDLTDKWRERAQTESVAHLLTRVAAPEQGRGGREATDKLIPGTAGLAVNDPGTVLPAGWQWVPLLRLAKQETGHTPSRSRSDYWNGGIPWIGIRDAGAHHGRSIGETMQTISDAGLANSSARLLPTGTVCLSRTASVGYVTMMSRPMATSQDFATWTCTEALLPEYLMFALMAEGDNIRKFGMGSTHTTIYFPEVRAFHIALPPMEEQREIVKRIRSALAHADRLEAEAARTSALLDRLESIILAKAFRGELVPQDPNDEPASVLLERIRTPRASAPASKRGHRTAAAQA